MIDAMITKIRVRQILDLLRAERKCLLSGPLADLLPLSEKREKLVVGLAQSRHVITKDDLALMQTESKRNEGLLMASIKGVNQARKQLEELREAQSKIGTYTRSGRMKNVVPSSNENLRRA